MTREEGAHFADALESTEDSEAEERATVAAAAVSRTQRRGAWSVIVTTIRKDKYRFFSLRIIR